MPAVLHSIPPEMDNLVWCMLPVGTHVWVGQEVGPVRVYSMKTYEKVNVLAWHQGGVPCMVSTMEPLSERRVFTGSLDFRC